MNLPTQILPVLLLAVLATGCATPLNVQTDGEEMAQILGIEQSEIRFLSYCTFDQIRASDDEGRIYFAHGIVAVSRTHFHLVKRYVDKGTERTEIIVPIPDLDGVGVTPPELGGIQVQLIDGDSVIAVVLKPKERSHELSKLLISDGVPQWHCETRYYTGNPMPDWLNFFPIPL
jgi:hypothetical protein